LSTLSDAYNNFLFSTFKSYFNFYTPYAAYYSFYNPILTLDYLVLRILSFYEYTDLYNYKNDKNDLGVTYTFLLILWKYVYQTYETMTWILPICLIRFYFT